MTVHGRSAHSVTCGAWHNMRKAAMTSGLAEMRVDTRILTYMGLHAPECTSAPCRRRCSGTCQGMGPSSPAHVT